MDHSMDKELAGWSHSKSCSQWLDVQVETSDKWRSSAVGTETGTNIFVNNMDIGIECKRPSSSFLVPEGAYKKAVE